MNKVWIFYTFMIISLMIGFYTLVLSLINAIHMVGIIMSSMLIVLDISAIIIKYFSLINFFNFS